MIKWALTTIVWFDRPTVLRFLHFDTQDSLNLLAAALSDLSFLGGDNIMDNLFSFTRTDGSRMGDTLLALIDTVRYSPGLINGYESFIYKSSFLHSSSRAIKKNVRLGRSLYNTLFRASALSRFKLRGQIPGNQYRCPPIFPQTRC